MIWPYDQILIAIYFRNKGPQAKKYNYELEEEKEEKDININYIYKNKENTSEQRVRKQNNYWSFSLITPKFDKNQILSWT